VWRVSVPDHVSELVLARTESVVAHDSAQLSHGDFSVVISVEERKGLFQAVQLGVRQFGGIRRRERLRSEGGETKESQGELTLI